MGCDNIKAFFAVEGVNTSGKTYLGTTVARKLQQQGVNAKYVHAFSEQTPAGRKFSSMGFFENPVLQTQLLFEDLTLRIRDDFRDCEVGIIDRYIHGMRIYQMNKTIDFQEQSEIEKLILERSRDLPHPTTTFVLEITYKTLCERYLHRYGRLPKREHEDYLCKLIADFSKANGVHIDNNIELESNIQYLTTIALEHLRSKT